MRDLIQTFCAASSYHELILDLKISDIREIYRRLERYHHILHQRRVPIGFIIHYVLVSDKWPFMDLEADSRRVRAQEQGSPGAEAAVSVPPPAADPG